MLRHASIYTQSRDPLFVCLFFSCFFYLQSTNPTVNQPCPVRLSVFLILARNGIMIRLTMTNKTNLKSGEFHAFQKISFTDYCCCNYYF